MENYWVSCKKQTDNEHSNNGKIKQNRIVLLSNCGVCGKKKSTLSKISNCGVCGKKKLTFIKNKELNNLG